MLKVRPQDVRFLAVMAVFAGLVFAVYREAVLGSPLEPLARWTARVTVLLLQGAGIEAVRATTVISHPGGFAYEVAYSCIGFLPVVFFAAAVFAYPVALIPRLVGVTIGIPALLLLNLGRLVHLFVLGVRDRVGFELWHEDLWPTIIGVTIVGLWISWACWAERRSQWQGDQSPSFWPLPPWRAARADPQGSG